MRRRLRPLRLAGGGLVPATSFPGEGMLPPGNGNGHHVLSISPPPCRSPTQDLVARFPNLQRFAQRMRESVFADQIADDKAEVFAPSRKDAAAAARA